MDSQRVKEIYEEATAELTTARAAVVHWEQVVVGLSGVMRTLPRGVASTVSHSHFGGPAEPEPKDPQQQDEEASSPYPRSPDAVENALRSRPNQPMRFPEVWKLIQEAGEADPSVKSGINAYQNAARRLALNPASPVQMTEDKRYVYRTVPDGTSGLSLVLPDPVEDASDTSEEGSSL